ncbi:cytochrome c/c1 heme-lyase [Lipomyces oligophaga]|uniref:cytochrome c/c1 heme-lyase n=1 Tax=Lipomyces oligophaga TaxID=45792 RepID=UPI0034CF5C79
MTSDNREAACPVNHEALKASAEGQECPVDHNSRNTWTSSILGKDNKKDNVSKPIPPSAHGPSNLNLAKDREISSIPRADMYGYNGGEGDHGGAVSGAQNWVYPSEEMFYSAMKRKNWDPQAADMRVVVPIHNAVNERAWQEILRWERPMGAEVCGGPKLVSFAGDSKNLSPRAWINSLLGYQEPFDRHDWIIDRCGKQIEYIIDFYAGRPDPNNRNIPTFYLDVRPKLSPEGAWMRFQRFVGLI